MNQQKRLKCTIVFSSSGKRLQNLKKRTKVLDQKLEK